MSVKSLYRAVFSIYKFKMLLVFTIMLICTMTFCLKLLNCILKAIPTGEQSPFEAVSARNVAQHISHKQQPLAPLSSLVLKPSLDVLAGH
mmetsp:Transcript_42591/g.90581  ORF Transcript_42591/g.90581 Transcript_42591/m.90581 type:complete len:90 (-) Transcript_42591:1313-1582(-)